MEVLDVYAIGPDGHETIAVHDVRTLFDIEPSISRFRSLFVRSPGYLLRRPERQSLL